MKNGPDINALMEQAKQSHEAALLVIGVLLDLIEKHKGDIEELKKLLAQAQTIIDKPKKPAKNSSNSGKILFDRPKAQRREQAQGQGEPAHRQKEARPRALHLSSPPSSQSGRDD